MEPVPNASEVLPRLWLGGWANWIEVSQAGIDAIVDMVGFEHPECEGAIDRRFKVILHWPIEDCEVLPPRAEIEVVAEATAALYRAGLSVLVCCGAGINRSALVVARTLMLVHGLSGQSAIEMVRDKRHGALTNETYTKFLKSLPA